MNPCSEDGCAATVTARGLCSPHYGRAKRAGTLPAKRTTWDRFRAFVEVTDQCWNWLGAKTKDGYGQFSAGSTVLAHRFAYEAAVMPIPSGLVIDHLCRNPSCVNPAHLEPVTQGENVLRGESPIAHQARQTECLRGHEFTAENTIRDSKGKRRCRICRDAHNRDRHPATIAHVAAQAAVDLDDEWARISGGGWSA